METNAKISLTNLILMRTVRDDGLEGESDSEQLILILRCKITNSNISMGLFYFL